MIRFGGAAVNHEPHRPEDSVAVNETLRPGEAGLAELERVYRTGAPARIHPDGRQAVMASAGVEQRAPRRTGAPLRRVVSTLRTAVPPLGADRALADDIEAARGLLRGGTLLEACEPCRLPPLEVPE